MLKIFLVEDEFVVREGIKKNIAWEENGYEFCGEASDGELAFPMIQKLKPDIVITDIKMPFMDGLSLSRLIKKEMPWVEIIILSGHEEFEFAKESIRIGVAQYILKPVSGAELLKEVDAVAEKIKEKRKEREIREMYLKDMEENFVKERKELFQHLVTGSKSVVELLEWGDKLELDLSALWYNILLFKIQSVRCEESQFNSGQVEVEKKIESLLDANHMICFDRGLDGKAILFKADSEERLYSLQKEYVASLKSLLDAEEDIVYFGGVGIPVNRLREIPKAFEKASYAFTQRYFVKENLILQSDELEKSYFAEDKEFSIIEVNPNQIDRRKIQSFLKVGYKEEVVYFLEAFFKALHTDAMKSVMFRQYIAMDIYFTVGLFLEELQISREEIEPLDASSGILQNEKSTVKYIASIMERAIELRESLASNRYRTVIEEAVGFIEKNFAQEELSLNSLAAHVNFSPNHLSMIFSQQTGKSFIKYLTDYRMDKAKELLRCTGKRSSEISREVGYKDSHYFSYLFKKTQGMTTTQYRGGLDGEGEEAHEG